MITLGTFTKAGTAFQGSILRRDFAGSIDIVSVGGGTAVAGTYRVYADGAPVGSAWHARDARGRNYLLVRLVGIGEAGPITCRLVLDRGGFHAARPGVSTSSGSVPGDDGPSRQDRSGNGGERDADLSPHAAMETAGRRKAFIGQHRRRKGRNNGKPPSAQNEPTIR
jgi:uncharacterized protein (DUF736 family)